MANYIKVKGWRWMWCIYWNSRDNFFQYFNLNGRP